jgi:hypothetical protein
MNENIIVLHELDGERMLKFDGEVEFCESVRSILKDRRRAGLYPTTEELESDLDKGLAAIIRNLDSQNRIKLPVSDGTVTHLSKTEAIELLQDSFNHDSDFVDLLDSIVDRNYPASAQTASAFKKALSMRNKFPGEGYSLISEAALNN